MSAKQPPSFTPPAPTLAYHWTITGQVQGVGFRPFVYRLAHRWNLTGWVRNETGMVEIHAEGTEENLNRFAHALVAEAPAIARPSIKHRQIDTSDHPSGFSILPSRTTRPPRIHVPPDYFTCAECLADVDDPDNRRFGYPFTNCTQCGPRYTLIERLPYDRTNTSMAGFPLCDDCRQEYRDPLDRRFHAEPIACPRCGPQLQYVDSTQTLDSSESAFAAVLTALHAGMIVAVKGIGGYHLVCDACNEDSVARLRVRKSRPDKPLAVMFPDPRNANDWLDRCVDLSVDERALLRSPQRPIVLARKQPAAPLTEGIAPRLNEIGVLFPYSPLHHLLSRAFAAPLVVTSGNLSGEPVLTDNAEAATRLASIADAFLHHNRPIVRPADDSVYRTIAGKLRPLRLGRGCAPLELQLPHALAEPVIAVGGHLKVTVCLAWGDRAVVSPHIGDMGSPRSRVVFEQVIEDLQALYAIRATHVIHDRHPDYSSTRWAQASGLPTTAVLHHHAHASALIGETGSNDDWLVFAWDGTGLGDDASLWGGETLFGRPGRWRRLGRLRPFRLPGGERAGRAPWRSAAALCWETGQGFALPQGDQDFLHQAWRQGINAPATSAAGRLFDAAASLASVLQTASFEGQGPMYLEALAVDAGTALELPLSESASGLWETDWSPLIAMLRDTGIPAARRASDFHVSLARAIRRQAELLARQHSFRHVGLTGGVFQNARLAELACAELQTAGFTVSLPEQLPCNDAGISFGQVVEALHRNME